MLQPGTLLNPTQQHFLPLATSETQTPKINVWNPMTSADTWTLKRHMVPTGTPGMGPKWLAGTMVHSLVRPTQAMPLPQSRREDDVADAIFAFFLLCFSFSPACTTSLESVRQLGQYLGQECHLYMAQYPSAKDRWSPSPWGHIQR